MSLAIGLLMTYMRWYHVFQCAINFIMGGALNGYLTTRIMRYFGADDWGFAASAASLALPSYCCANFIIVDLLDWWSRSSAAFPVTTLFMYGSLWLILNVPCAYYFSYFGYTTSTDKPPCKVSIVRKTIPE